MKNRERSVYKVLKDGQYNFFFFRNHFNVRRRAHGVSEHIAEARYLRRGTALVRADLVQKIAIRGAKLIT